jgi:ribosomal-protein-alanine N-acetyltransferase
MRRYENGQNGKLMEVVCNKCGRVLKVKDGYLKEFCFAADTAFGYFSRKDGVTQHFDLCEDCYDSLTSQFLVPVEETERTELL